MLLTWEVLFVMLLGEMRYYPADSALHLLLEKSLVIFHGTYLQIACSYVDFPAGSSKSFSLLLSDHWIDAKRFLGAFKGRVSFRKCQLKVFASDTRLCYFAKIQTLNATLLRSP